MSWTDAEIKNISPRLMAFFRRKNVALHDAEDLMQETFLALWKSQANDGFSAVVTKAEWPLIYLNAGQRLCDFQRRRRGRRKSRKLVLFDSQAVNEASADCWGTEQSGLIEHEERDKCLRLLKNGIGTVAAELIWDKSCGKSLKVMAARRGISVYLVKTLLEMAIEMLRDSPELQEFRDDYGDR